VQTTAVHTATKYIATGSINDAYDRRLSAGNGTNDDGQWADFISNGLVRHTHTHTHTPRGTKTSKEGKWTL